MAEEIKDKIAQVSEATELAIRRKTAEMLPDNPTAAGMKANDIKAAFYKGIADGNMSVLAEIKRVISEANEVFGAITNSESEIREQADKALDNKIDTEVGDRKAEDGKLSGRIDTEERARTDADNAIKDKFEWEMSRLSAFVDNLAEDRIVTKVLTEDDSKLGTGTSVVQVGAALKYGLVNYVSGDTKYIRTYVPYDLDNAQAFGGAKVKRVGNTLIFPKGSKYGIYIPVNPSIIGSFIIRAYGRNDSGDYWAKVTPMDSKNAVTGNSETLGSEVDFGDYTSSVQISKYNASAASIDDMPLYDIQIEATPGQGEAIYQYPLYNEKEYEIPPEVRDLCVNGWEDTINLIDRKIECFGGGTIDISEYIKEDFCEIPLMSSNIIRFEDGDGNVNCRFKITYKERIHGNLNNKL